MDRYRISQVAERTGMPATTLDGAGQAERTERRHDVLAGAPREDLAGGGITLDAHAPEGAAELLRELLAC